MERPRLVCSLGALLVVSALGAACSPLAEGPPRPDKSAPAQVSARRAAITAQQAVTAAQNGLNFVLSDAYSWISANGCAACHRGGLPVFAGALSVKNGLSVNRSQLDFLATKAATEQLQWGDNFWKHDPTYELRFNKGSFEAWGLAGYIAYSGNTSAMNQMKGAWDWLIGQTNNGAYNPAATSAAYYNATYYTGTKWNYTCSAATEAPVGERSASGSRGTVTERLAESQRPRACASPGLISSSSPGLCPVTRPRAYWPSRRSWHSTPPRW